MYFRADSWGKMSNKKAKYPTIKGGVKPSFLDRFKKSGRDKSHLTLIEGGYGKTESKPKNLSPNVIEEFVDEILDDMEYFVVGYIDEDGIDTGCFTQPFCEENFDNFPNCCWECDDYCPK